MIRESVMSQLFSLPSLELLLIAGRAIALVAGLLIFAWAFRHWRKAAMRDTQRVFEQLDLVRSELLIMKEVMHHSTHRAENTQSPTGFRTDFTDRRANSRGDQLRSDAKPQIPFEARMPAISGTARGYENAARMARSGATKEELIRNCGITGHEAELLVKLHGQRNAASAAEMVGRRQRTDTANPTMNSASMQAAASARQSATAQVLQNASRQPSAAPRQATAAPSAQRTPERSPAKNPALPPRSRLVAVG
jgi:Protein of unknown function (DUF2802)